MTVVVFGVHSGTFRSLPLRRCWMSGGPSFVHLMSQCKEQSATLSSSSQQCCHQIYTTRATSKKLPLFSASPWEFLISPSLSFCLWLNTIITFYIHFVLIMFCLLASQWFLHINMFFKSEKQTWLYSHSLLATFAIFAFFKLLLNFCISFKDKQICLMSPLLY